MMRRWLARALPTAVGSASGLLALLLTTLAKGDAPAAPSSSAVSALSSSNEAGAGDRLDEEARRPAVDVQLALPSTGVIGAWLVAGPFKAAKAALESPPAGIGDETTLKPQLGATLGRDREGGRSPAAKWILASTGTSGTSTGRNPGRDGSRPLDLKTVLDGGRGTDLVAYAAGRLHVAKPGKYYLLLSVDDGVRVIVDGAVVHSREEARPMRDDDDVIPLDLTEGDHDVVLKLHQRDGAWTFRARFVDAKLSPPPGAYLTLPGTNADDARALAAKMSWLVVDRTFDARATPPRYRPVLTVRYPEGAPRGVPIAVDAKLVGAGPSSFDVRAGGVAVGAEGVSDLVVALPAIEPWTQAAMLETTVAGRKVTSTFSARPVSERALARAERALARGAGDESWLLPGSLDSVRHLTARLANLVAQGDGDAQAQLDEARELERLVINLERGVDPYHGTTGAMRRALVTPFDNQPSEFGLYVPPSYKPGSSRKYPLVVGLHGLNSFPMSMMRALFGFDDDKKPASWKDRHPVPLPAVDAFVITPYAHGNAMYREIGEVDVLYLTKWASEVFPIDEARITITGPSMGGTGSAALPLRYPHVFAGAAPLCGYHSYLIRPSVISSPKRPWERYLLEERSNANWAENGQHLPLWIVHGTRDLPEANSGVLIRRYEALQYPIKHDHPDAGHNVWSLTYGELKGLRWLLSQRLDPRPPRVRFRTTRTRYAKSAWLTIDELAGPSSWGEVDATAKGPSAYVVTTRGVSAMTLAPDAKRAEARAPSTVTVDGVSLQFEPGETLSLHRAASGTWEKGPAKHERPVKRGRVTGPIRDVFHEPLLFVYGAGEAALANELVARSFAERPGVHASYPIMTDTEFFANQEALANDRALFLVGRTNRVLATLDTAARSAGTPLPMHVDHDGITLGSTRFVGRELGGAFVYPNPLRPDRYVVIVAGVDVPGTLRARALPELLPDFVVWDEGVASARGRLLLGDAHLRAAGFFEKDWSLPNATNDPLAPKAAGLTGAAKGTPSP